MGEFVCLEVDEASRVGTIRLDRPPVNALNAQLQDELLAAAEEAARELDRLRQGWLNPPDADDAVRLRCSRASTSSGAEARGR